jgi:UDP-N-acetylmuramoyl-tripeptide--D-alanyl-D-alanine ligase
VARRDRASRPDLGDYADRLLLVDDAIAALQTLARRVYEAWGKPVVAITGSAGKTTTKDMTAEVVAAGGRRVLKSTRNYNNGLGLPLAVLQMVSDANTPDDFDIAVLEMGMSSPTHEIRRLCAITPLSIKPAFGKTPPMLCWISSGTAFGMSCCRCFARNINRPWIKRFCG